VPQCVREPADQATEEQPGLRRKRNVRRETEEDPKGHADRSARGDRPKPPWSAAAGRGGRALCFPFGPVEARHLAADRQHVAPAGDVAGCRLRGRHHHPERRAAAVQPPRDARSRMASRDGELRFGPYVK